MNATRTAPRRKPSRKSRGPRPRPVSAVLLELAYYLHTTRVVSRPAEAPAR
jgi:hypothetical protein